MKHSVICCGINAFGVWSINTKCSLPDGIFCFEHDVKPSCSSCISDN
jgi:hypothetical protein